jgi:hypothetical protein
MSRGREAKYLKDVALVIDTAGFLSGYIATIYGTKIYTVKEVLEEVKDSWSKERLELILNAHHAARLSRRLTRTDRSNQLVKLISSEYIRCSRCF